MIASVIIARELVRAVLDRQMAEFEQLLESGYGLDEDEIKRFRTLFGQARDVADGFTFYASSDERRYYDVLMANASLDLSVTILHVVGERLKVRLPGLTRENATDSVMRDMTLFVSVMREQVPFYEERLLRALRSYAEHEPPMGTHCTLGDTKCSRTATILKSVKETQGKRQDIRRLLEELRPHTQRLLDRQI